MEMTAVGPSVGARPAVSSAEDSGRSLDRRPRPAESAIRLALFLCGAVSVLTTAAIVLILVRESARFLASPAVSLVAFLTGTRWQPTLGQFGIWPLLSATLVVTAIAMLVALPLGLLAAVYLSEHASERTRVTVKPTLEVLAGIPTVVFGYFALTFVTPMLRTILGDGVVQIYNMASAGIVVGIAMIPLVTSLSEDALHAVPRSLREAAFGLGATPLETSLQVVVPAALSGIAAAFLLAVSRAAGETMIVAIAAGAGPNLAINPFRAAETITGNIVRISGGDLSYGSIDYQGIFGLALVLFVMTLVLNMVSRRVVARFREAYD